MWNVAALGQWSLRLILHWAVLGSARSWRHALVLPGVVKNCGIWGVDKLLRIYSGIFAASTRCMVLLFRGVWRFVHALP